MFVLLHFLRKTWCGYLGSDMVQAPTSAHFLLDQQGCETANKLMTRKPAMEKMSVGWDWEQLLSTVLTNDKHRDT